MSRAEQRRRSSWRPAWPYASGKRHLGHVVGFAVPADIFARYHRLKGNDVLMVSGTDEHGTPVMVTADREGVSPREIAERYNELIRKDLRDLGITYDSFTRTTTRNHAARHDRTCSAPSTSMAASSRETTLGAFSASTGNTLPDRYIEGTCPICGYTGGARRPVRQLRQPARPGRSDRAALDHRRVDAGVQGDDASLPRPARVRRPAATVDRVEDELAAERAQLLAFARRRPEAARDDA